MYHGWEEVNAICRIKGEFALLVVRECLRALLLYRFGICVLIRLNYIYIICFGVLEFPSM